MLADESALIVNPVVLNAELNFLFDGIIFNWYHQVKINFLNAKKRHILWDMSMKHLPSSSHRQFNSHKFTIIGESQQELL